MAFQESNELEYSQPDNVVELVDIIENMFENKPSKKGKKMYKVWADKLNGLIDTCNKLAKHPIYAKIVI